MTRSILSALLVLFIPGLALFAQDIDSHDGAWSATLRGGMSMLTSRSTPSFSDGLSSSLGIGIEYRIESAFSLGLSYDYSAFDSRNTTFLFMPRDSRCTEGANTQVHLFGLDGKLYLREGALGSLYLIGAAGIAPVHRERATGKLDMNEQTGEWFIPTFPEETSVGTFASAGIGAEIALTRTLWLGISGEFLAVENGYSAERFVPIRTTLRTILF